MSLVFPVTYYRFGDRSFVHNGVDSRHVEIISSTFDLRQLPLSPHIDYIGSGCDQVS